MRGGTYTKYGCTYGPKGNRIYSDEERNEEKENIQHGESRTDSGGNISRYWKPVTYSGNSFYAGRDDVND